MSMKKYILTIKFDDSTDTIEWLQEEIISDDDLPEFLNKYKHKFSSDIIGEA
mgnify:FL=1